MDKSPADVLEDAADLLLIRGRCRGQLIDSSGSLCAIGALTVASGRELVGTDTWADLRASVLTFDAPATKALARRVDPVEGDTRSIWLWNDDGATTDDDVRDTFLLVAKDLRAKADPS